MGHKHIDAICLGALALAVALVLGFPKGRPWGSGRPMPSRSMFPGCLTPGGSTTSTSR